MKILGIESSCDDTSVSLFDARFGVRWMWTQTHREPIRNRGIIPELAAQAHHRNFYNALRKNLPNFRNVLSQVSAIAYTSGPGLLGSLWIGASTAHSLGYCFSKPVIPVDHIKGHIFSAFLPFALQEIPFPFLALLASGGNTQLWWYSDFDSAQCLGSTRDDAAGEAIDKAARALGLSYPGGPALAQFACGGDEKKFSFPIPKCKGSPFDFSFSGLKTAFISRLKQCDSKQKRKDLAASFQYAIVRALLAPTKSALEYTNTFHLVVVGGVCANQSLFSAFITLAKERNLLLYVPAPAYRGDNAAMIAYLGSLLFSGNNKPSIPSLDPLKIYTTTIV